MGCACLEGLGLTTAVNTLAAAVLTQLGDTLATIAVVREACGKRAPEPV